MMMGCDLSSAYRFPFTQSVDFVYNCSTDWWIVVSGLAANGHSHYCCACCYVPMELRLRLRHWATRIQDEAPKSYTMLGGRKGGAVKLKHAPPKQTSTWERALQRLLPSNNEL